MSIGHNIPESAVAEANKLASSVQAFIAAGGPITALPGCSYKPRPARSHPTKDNHARRGRREAGHVRRYRLIGPDLIDMYDKRDMTIKQISEATGEGKVFITNCLQFYGYDTSVKRGRQPGTPKEPEMVARLRAMAGDRYTMRYAATCAGISLENCAKLVEEHGIAFPSELQAVSGRLGYR